MIRRSVAWTVVFGLAVAASTSASGPGLPEPVFWSDREPDDLVAFLDGRLGVLTPGLRQDLRLVAYLHLTGLGLPAGARGVWEGRLGLASGEVTVSRPSGLQRWREARAATPGLDDRPWISTSASLSLETDGGARWIFWENCLDDAFATAAGRLETLAGRSSEEILAWIEAQDLVFANCSSPGAGVPDELPASASPVARQEREYQRAAALFYATRFEEAILAFDEIARSSSASRSLAALAAARARIRQATLELVEPAAGFARARGALERVLAEPTFAEVHASAERLLRYVRLRAEPLSVLAERLEAFLAPKSGGLDAEGIRELLWLLDRSPSPEGLSEAGTELLTWLSSARVRPGDVAAASVVEQWRRSPESPLWLLTALWATTGGDPWAGELLQAVETTTAAWRATPAAPSLDLHRARLLLELGRSEETARMAEAALAVALGAGRLEDANRWTELHALAAPDLETLAKRGQLQPLQFQWNGTSWRSPLAELPTGYDFEPGQRLWSDRIARRLDREASLSVLLQIAGDEEISPPLRRRAARAGWVRAALLGEAREADDLARALSAVEPGLSADLADFLAAEGVEERRFAAAVAMLRHPGLGPQLRSGFGRSAPIGERALLADNGWCGGGWRGVETVAVSTSDKGRLAPEVERLRELEPAPVALGGIAIDWSRQHPDDPRAPEALHRVVVATRYGCRESERNGEVSKAAFQLLHSHFPGSEWTERTPYWFR